MRLLTHRIAETALADGVQPNLDVGNGYVYAPELSFKVRTSAAVESRVGGSEAGPCRAGERKSVLVTARSALVGCTCALRASGRFASL